MYQKIRFEIKSKYRDGVGMKGRESTAFYDEVRNLFESAGWTVQNPENETGCPSAYKGKQSLYLHPERFSGIIDRDEVAAIQKIISEAHMFKLKNTVFCGIYQDMSDEDYTQYLESKQEEIEAAILEAHRTKRKNLYYNGPLTKAISEYFRIRRLGDNHVTDPIATRFVDGLIREMISDGRLDQVSTERGIGIRTANPGVTRRKPLLEKQTEEAAHRMEMLRLPQEVIERFLCEKAPVFLTEDGERIEPDEDMAKWFRMLEALTRYKIYMVLKAKMSDNNAYALLYVGQDTGQWWRERPNIYKQLTFIQAIPFFKTDPINKSPLSPASEIYIERLPSGGLIWPNYEVLEPRFGIHLNFN